MPRPNSPRSMSADQTACEDLKAFERRLTEVVTYMRPKASMWRFVLFFSALFAFLGGCMWVSDPVTFQLPFTSSLYNHMFFTVSFVIFVILMMFGIHKRVVGPQIIVSRVRSVLADFNMSCDDNGRLILNPRPLNAKDKRKSEESLTMPLLGSSMSSSPSTSSSSTSSSPSLSPANSSSNLSINSGGNSSLSFRNSASTGDLYPNKWYS